MGDFRMDKVAPHRTRRLAPSQSPLAALTVRTVTVDTTLTVSPTRTLACRHPLRLLQWQRAKQQQHRWVDVRAVVFKRLSTQNKPRIQDLVTAVLSAACNIITKRSLFFGHQKKKEETQKKKKKKKKKKK